MKLRSILIVSLFVLGGFAGFLDFGSENALGTYVSGPISVNTTWDMAGSPYIIIENVIVIKNIKLTIEPGVVVKFNEGRSIFVNGTFLSVGTDTNPINITSNLTSPQKRDWNSIQINFSGYAEIKYTEISYGDEAICLQTENSVITDNYFFNNYYAVSAYSGWNNISYNLMLNNSYGMNLYYSSGNTIIGNNFSEGGAGIYAWGSKNNRIYDNIMLNNGRGITFYSRSDDNKILNNIISNNAFEGIRLDSSRFNNMSNNRISNNSFGVSMLDTWNNILINNTFFDDGLRIWGWELKHYNTYLISMNNTVNGKPIRYLRDSNSISLDNVPVGQLIIANCTDVNISNLTITDVEIGMMSAFSSNISIKSNYVSNNYRHGIYLTHSENSNVSGNNVSVDFYEGIYLEASSNNTLFGNSVSFSDEGISLTASDNCTIKSNNLIENDAGVRFFISANNSIEQNTFSRNKWGISFQSSDDNSITNNTFIENIHMGIAFHTSENNTIEHNEMSNNDIAIRFYISLFNVIKSNNITQNNLGFRITPSSPYNKFFHNNIIQNNKQAEDEASISFWNETYPSGGNHWSDYSPICEDKYSGSITPQVSGSPDGICDIQYEIDLDSIDNFPLAGPDISPPLIDNIQPAHESTINQSVPLMKADYSDSSGINVSSVILTLDGIDVSSSAMVTENNITYVPASALSEGNHSVLLELKDRSLNANLAYSTWNFTIDITAPTANAGQDRDVMLGENVTFDGNASSDNLSDIDELTLTWKIFKDGVLIATLHGVKPHFAFDEEGMYEVNLTVRDKAGNTDYDTLIVNVQEPAPFNEPGAFQYWWLLVLILAVLIILIFVLLMMRKKRKAEVVTESEEKDVEESETEDSGGME